MELFGEIENLTYKKVIDKPLEKIKVDSKTLNINALPPICLLEFEDVPLSVSKWVSPKRTRSYPYARVYDTLQREVSKTVTIIPIVKDEGEKGDRDFIQWDTISLMSLLNVYVIPAYYCDAKKSQRQGKITEQKFDNTFLVAKLKELIDYRASALHWNLNELSRENLGLLIDRVIECYRYISKKTGVNLHSESGLLEFKSKLSEGVDRFKSFSRSKAKEAQRREAITVQPKEVIGEGVKAKLTIKNYLGGFYYFTVDEVFIEGDTVFLVEGKHSRKDYLPSESDIKDGLLKMILYTNISKLRIGSKLYNFVPVLKLTSEKLRGRFINEETLFLQFGKRQRSFMENLIKEAKLNGFQVWLEGKGD